MIIVNRIWQGLRMGRGSTIIKTNNNFKYDKMIPTCINCNHSYEKPQPTILICQKNAVQHSPQDECMKKEWFEENKVIGCEWCGKNELKEIAEGFKTVNVYGIDHTICGDCYGRLGAGR